MVIVLSPHLVDASDTGSVAEPAGGWGTLLVTVRLRVSPGFTCSVGDTRPSGVLKQKSVRPASSRVVKYSSTTFNTPSRLKRSGGGETMLPAAGRGQGSRGGAPPSAAKTFGGANANIAMQSNIVGKKEFLARDICRSSLPLVDAIDHRPCYCPATGPSVSRLTPQQIFPGDARRVRT